MSPTVIAPADGVQTRLLKVANCENVSFRNLVINGTLITDTMSGKPAWYKTADMARIFVGEHVSGITFSK